MYLIPGIDLHAIRKSFKTPNMALSRAFFLNILSDIMPNLFPLHESLPYHGGRICVSQGS